MKVNFEQFKEQIGSTAAEKGAEAVADGEVAEETASNVGGTTIEDIIDDELSDIIADNVRNSLRDTFDQTQVDETPSVSTTDAIKSFGEALQDPTVKRVITEAWYGKGGKDNNEAKRVESTTSNPTENTDMITKDAVEGDSIEYEPNPEEIHGLLTEFVEFISKNNPDKTSQEIFYDIHVIYSMAAQAANREPETTANEMETLIHEHPDIFKEQIAEFIEQMD